MNIIDGVLGMKKYNVGSLFAGVGGICAAFKSAACDVIWANEVDSHSCETYELNHKDTFLIKDDIRNLKTVPYVDILTAGFPCQPFSMAGSARGFDDERGQLFFDVVRILKEVKPSAYLLENVKTLCTHDDGKSFKRISKHLRDAGYSFIPFVLRASDCTSIPQGRERVYIVGFKGESHFFYDDRVSFNEKFLFNAPLSSSFRIPGSKKVKNKSIRDYLEADTVLGTDIYNDRSNKIHKRVIDAAVDKDKVYQYRRYFVRENKSNVCPTLTANMGDGGHNIPIILDGDFPRRLTPKECFNLQGFRRKFKLPENIARSRLYKQAGNTVVVPVVAMIAKEMVRVLSENTNCKSKSK